MKNADVRILVVDDEPAICEVLQASLRDDEFNVKIASSGVEALKAYSSFQPHIVLLDVWMPGDLDGVDVLKDIKSKSKSAHVIMMSGHGTIETAVQAVKNGAYDFIEKPISFDRISILINNIMAYESERQGKENLLSHIQNSLRLINISEESRRIKQLVTKVASSDSWNLIQNKHNTGKKTIAKNIHFLSHRTGGNFIELKCSNIPKQLLYGEIFGYSKSSQPGMSQDKPGVLSLAHKGTLYLDGASALTDEVQQALIEYLKTGKSKKAGGDEYFSSDVRILFGSDKPIKDLVQSGAFREDLFLRINIMPFEVRPLRDRTEDIPTLYDHFEDEVCRKLGGLKKFIRPEALDILKSYKWPGNVTELQNLVERLYILADQVSEIGVEDLSYAGLMLTGKAGAVFNSFGTFREARAQFEKEFLLAKIEENNGNISKTSEAIGLERSYLHRKIKAYGIEVN
jgi:two-component system, NtrC family, nitrogen regulation response regulator NtrX